MVGALFATVENISLGIRLRAIVRFTCKSALATARIPIRALPRIARDTIFVGNLDLTA
jgi:hypothetical protein